MAVQRSGGDDKRTLKIGIAVGLFVIAGAVVAWQFLREKRPTVSEETAQKALEVQQAIKNASPNAPVVPDQAPKRSGPVQKSEGRAPAQVAPK
jgi:hypothetical protein